MASFIVRAEVGDDRHQRGAKSPPTRSRYACLNVSVIAEEGTERQMGSFGVAEAASSGRYFLEGEKWRELREEAARRRS